MSNSPTANITHVTIFGDRNSGKSSLFNAIINQDIAIVDDTFGTTTDPVHKRIELIPYGPVLFTDTAGVDDDGLLGVKRVEKTKKMFSQTDFAIVVIDVSLNVFNHEIEKELEQLKIPYVKVFNKIDLISEKQLSELKLKYNSAIFVNCSDFNSVVDFKSQLIQFLKVKEDKSIIGKYLNSGDKVVLVVPIDSEAPKGRLILPQVQVIRDLLDHNVIVSMTNEKQLKDILTNDTKMVITDSQVFNEVKDVVSDDIYLTSFSIIFAHFKGDLNNYSLELPLNVEKVLICESCTHNVSHEDIGMVKIPKLLNKRYPNVKIDHVMGNDFVKSLNGYDLIIHCGSCMLNDAVLSHRINLASEHNIPFINYGLYLAIESNILNRSIQFFKDSYILN